MTIKDILEEFNNTFTDEDNNLNEALRQAELRDFLILSIKQAMEEITPERKTGMNGEGLPFETRPGIYGNKRIEAYKKGFNESIDQLEANFNKFFNKPHER